jgi:3-oxoacyl-[acyl-carrier protein] reductase
MELKEKVALITGSGQGLGKMTAECFVKEGAKVIISDVIAERVRIVAEELKQSGYKVEYVVGDVRFKKNADDMVKKAVDSFGRLDILVNNAGICNLGPIDEMSEKDWDDCIEVDIKGVFLCTQAAVKVMKKQNEGCIINMSSIHGLQGMPERGPYSVAKAGVVNLTRTLAAELGRYNIRVNCVAPGFTMTDGFKYMASIGTVNIKELTDRIPLGKIGDPVDIANSIIFLASEKSKYITGVTIPIDGGWLADGGRGMLRPSDIKKGK